MNHEATGFPPLNVDAYAVNKSADGDWVITLMQGANTAGELRAYSKKQAHFVARSKYPNAVNADTEAGADYNSAEGRAYRRKMEKK